MEQLLKEFKCGYNQGDLHSAQHDAANLKLVTEALLMKHCKGMELIDVIMTTNEVELRSEFPPDMDEIDDENSSLYEETPVPRVSVADEWRQLK